jgi:hypothetical protein
MRKSFAGKRFAGLQIAVVLFFVPLLIVISLFSTNSFVDFYEMTNKE